MVGGPSDADLPVLGTKGIDPVVQMGKLESLLTGVDYAAVVANPRSGHPVAIRDDGERLVLTMTDDLQSALALASPQRLDAVAVPWSRTEESGGYATVEDLAQFLGEFARLARDARDNGTRLYCWVCV